MPVAAMRLQPDAPPPPVLKLKVCLCFSITIPALSVAAGFLSLQSKFSSALLLFVLRYSRDALCQHLSNA